jgi:hypothetical protein
MPEHFVAGARAFVLSIGIMSAAVGSVGCSGGGASGAGGHGAGGTIGGAGAPGTGGRAGTGGGATAAGGAGGGATASGGAGGGAIASGGGGGTAVTGGSGGTGTGGSATGGTAGAGPSCSPSMTYGGGETSMTGASVTATVVDETGAPIAVGQPVYLCGINICEAPGETMANGAVSIQTAMSMKKAAIKVGDGVAYAEIAIPLTMMTTDFTTGGHVLTTGKLSNKPGATLTPGASATSGDVTVTLAAGASVGINGLTYDTADSQKLRAVNIPIANDGPWIAPIAADGGMGASLLYGVAPSETLFCPLAKITVALSHATTSPNDLGWAPGAAVEFWITTIDTGQYYAPYAGWAKTSDGVVSADGASVSTVDGQGFIALDIFAIRLKP